MFWVKVFSSPPDFGFTFHQKIAAFHFRCTDIFVFSLQKKLQQTNNNEMIMMQSYLLFSSSINLRQYEGDWKKKYAKKIWLKRKVWFLVSCVTARLVSLSLSMWVCVCVLKLVLECFSSHKNCFGNNALTECHFLEPICFSFFLLYYFWLHWKLLATKTL